MFYSESTGGFYKAKIHGDSVPSDAVEISAARHIELLAGRAEGKTIALDENGAPILQDPPAPSIEDIRASTVVSRFQARAALHRAGHLETVKAMMAADDADPIAKLAWEDAQEFRRLSPTVLAIAAALSLTDEEIDALFEGAATIEA